MPRFKFSHLSIPGTHGTWPKKTNYAFEAWDNWYVAVTWTTWQSILFFTRN